MWLGSRESTNNQSVHGPMRLEKHTRESLKSGGGFLLDVFPKFIRNEEVVNAALIRREVWVVVPDRSIHVILDLLSCQLYRCRVAKTWADRLLEARRVRKVSPSVQAMIEVRIWSMAWLEGVESVRNWNFVLIGLVYKPFEGQSLTVRLTKDGCWVLPGTNSWTSDTTQSGVLAS